MFSTIVLATLVGTLIGHGIAAAVLIGMIYLGSAAPDVNPPVSSIDDHKRHGRESFKRGGLM